MTDNDQVHIIPQTYPLWMAEIARTTDFTSDGRRQREGYTDDTVRYVANMPDAEIDEGITGPLLVIGWEIRPGRSPEPIVVYAGQQHADVKVSVVDPAIIGLTPNDVIEIARGHGREDREIARRELEQREPSPTS